MKDFALRLYDSENKEMVVITECNLKTFYKLHSGLNSEEPMIASPYYDVHGERLFENDVVIPLVLPKWASHLWEVEQFPKNRGDFCDEAMELEIEYYVVGIDDSWYLKGEIGIYGHSWDLMSKKLLRSDNWRSIKYANKNSIGCIKVGDIWSCAELINSERRKHEMKKEVEKREKELQCLMKLKAKYENPDECESEA